MNGDPEARSRPVRVLMTVDDAGDFLLLAGDEVLLGHARGDDADIPVLADVGVHHAVFRRRTTLSGGVEWRVASVGGERVLRNAEPIARETAIAHDDELLLGSNLRLVVAQPDPASDTTVLHFQGGVDSLGAGHVILFAPGPGGRLRIGARGGRHVLVPNLDPGLELTRGDGQLRVASPAGVASLGGSPAPELLLPNPPFARVDLTIGGPMPGGRPPFSISLVAG